jgi:hypothetical protein
MKILSSFTLLILLSGCAQNAFRARVPETQEEKIARYQSRNIKHNPPLSMSFSDQSWTILQQNVSPQKKGQRGPASVEATNAISKKKKKSTVFEEVTPRRLYFLSLFHQLRLLQEHSQAGQSELLSRSCPAFHSTLVDYKKWFSPKQKKWNPTFAHWPTYNFKDGQMDLASALFPELVLPTSELNKGPTIWSELHQKIKPEMSANEKEMIFKNVLEAALSQWQIRIDNEVKELCEFGHSDNYYAFENLVTTIKERPETDQKKSLSALFKITILQNQAIMASLSDQHKRHAKRSVANVSIIRTEEELTRDILSRLHAEWAENYFILP